jgi:hypothetical protein
MRPGVLNQLIELWKASRTTATSNTLTNASNHATAGIPHPNSNNFTYPTCLSPGTVKQMSYETDSAKNSGGCIMKFCNKDKYKSVNTYLVLNRDLNFKQLSNMSYLTLTNKKLKMVKTPGIKIRILF